MDLVQRQIVDMLDKPTLDIRIESDDGYSGFAGISLLITVHLPCPRRGTVGEVLDLGDRVFEIVRTIDQGGYTYERVKALLLSGKLSDITGAVESDWLEVKAYPYKLDDEAGKIELAQDVARFANSDKAALLIIGLRTRRQRNGDEEIICKPLRNEFGLKATRYRSVIARRVHPFPDGLSITTVPISAGKSIMVIDIPRQARMKQPYLVTGAIVGSRIEGAFISIVRRVGEGSEPLTGASIHAALSAGYRVLEQDRIKEDK